MIGILIIIPVIILATVSLVSVVVSTRAHIGVEEISFDKSVLEIAFSENVYDINDFLTVTILPDRASDKTCTWEISNVSCFDDVYRREYEYYLEHQNDDNASVKEVLPPVTLVDAYGSAVDENTTGLFKVNSGCAFVISGMAETFTASCTVSVVDDVLKAVEVKGADSLSESGNALLSMSVSPVGATFERVEWISSDENVLTVDANGAVNAFKAGSATVIARVYTSDEEYIDSAPYEITVEKNVTLLGADVATHERRIALSAFGVNASDIINTVNCTIDGEYIVIADDKTEANFETANGVCTLTVTDGMQIKNKNLYAYDEERESFVFSVGDKLALQAVWKSAFKSDEIVASWVVDDSEIATVDEFGTLTALKDGVVKVAVTVGAFSDEIEIMIRSKVATVILDKTKDEFKEIGLALEYVIPTLRYSDVSAGTLTANYIDVELAFPTPAEDKESFYDAFTFTLLENGEVSDKGYFDGNRLFFNHDKVTGKTELTVKVSAKYPRYEGSKLTTDSVDIKVVNGVAIDSYAALRKTADARQENMVLVKNITLYDVPEGQFDGDSSKCVYESNYASQLHIYKSLYGNGNIFSAESGQLTNNMSGLVYVKGNDVLISNIIMRANRAVKDIITSEDTEGLKGVCVMAGALYGGDGGPDQSAFVRGNRSEYCIFENADVLYKALTCETYLVGCIFRNSSGVGIYTRAWARNKTTTMYTYLTMENCVMSNLTGLSLSLDFNEYSAQGEEHRDRLIAEGRVTTFHQKGFLDIYNWQPISTMRFLPDTAIGQGSAEIALAQMINALLREKITDKSLDSYRYSYNRDEYFHLGFMSTGMLDKSCLSGSIQDKRITTFTSDMVPGVGDLVENTCYFFVYDNKTEDITPASTYTINKKLINRLHGVGVEYGEPVQFSFI